MTDSTPTPEFTMQVIDEAPVQLGANGAGKLRGVYAAAEALPEGKVLEVQLSSLNQATWVPV